MNKEKRNILITGSGGMLGQAVYNTLKTYNNILATDIDLNEKWLKYLDVRDLDSLSLVCKSLKPDLLINLAALTDLEFCENHPEDTYLTNGLDRKMFVYLPINTIYLLFIFLPPVSLMGLRNFIMILISLILLVFM